MDTVGKILTHVSGQLSDQQRQREFIRWPRQVLAEYLNQGLAEIATYRPDAFSATVDVILRPGAKQTIDTLGSVDSVEVNGVPLNVADISIYKAFSAYATCPPKIRMHNGRPQFKLRSVAIDPDQKGVFYVSPTIPAGLNLVAKVTVVGSPPQYTLMDWAKPVDMQLKYVNDLIDFMLARAYQRDTESQVSAAKSQRLFSIFYQRMGVKYKIDSAFNSGYYKGDVGTGDPRAAMT